MNYFIPLFVLAACAFILWQQRQTYRDTIEQLAAQNKTLLDRLLMKHQMPPSNIDVGQRFEERQVVQNNGGNNSGKRKTLGPLERLTQEWAAKDLKEAEKSRR